MLCREPRSYGRERPAVWVAVFFACLGLALTALVCVVVLPGGSVGSYSVARLGIILPILVVCALSALAALGFRRASPGSIWFWGATVVAGAVGNLALPFVLLGKSAWGCMIPLMPSAGNDFRDGLYFPAEAFSPAQSGWPPLTLIIGRPFTLLSQDSGYIVQLVVLVALGLAAVALSVSLAAKAFAASGPGNRGVSKNSTLLMPFLAFWLVTSYGFLFELERGNINTYALFFSVMAVWWLLRFPGSVWLPAIFLAIAINLKLYPGILLVLVFWRYRWRALLPVVVSNAALLFVAGPSNLWTFGRRIVELEANPIIREYNHSAESFARSLHESFAWFPTWTEYLLLALPVALWVATAVVLMRRGWGQKGVLLLATASVPLMNVVPAFSFDYKLVLMVFPVVVLVVLLFQPDSGRLGSRSWRSALAGLVALEMVALSGATRFWGHGNKFPLLVFAQLLVLAVAILTGTTDDRGTQKAAASGTGEAGVVVQDRS